MFRGTTPTNTFGVDIDCTTAEQIYITYAQNKKTVVEKTIDDVTVTPEEISVVLTQEETLRFRESDVEIQIRVKFPDGKAMACDIIKTPAKRILKEGVI